MARKKSKGKSKKPIALTKGRKPITEEDVELYDGPTRGKRGFKIEPDFTPAATFPVPIDPVERRMFPGSIKIAKIKVNINHGFLYLQFKVGIIVLYFIICPSASNILNLSA